MGLAYAVAVAIPETAIPLAQGASAHAPSPAGHLACDRLDSTPWAVPDARLAGLPGLARPVDRPAEARTGSDAELADQPRGAALCRVRGLLLFWPTTDPAPAHAPRPGTRGPAGSASRSATRGGRDRVGQDRPGHHRPAADDGHARAVAHRWRSYLRRA